MYKSDSSFYIFQINCSKPTFQYKKKKKKKDRKAGIRRRQWSMGMGR